MNTAPVAVNDVITVDEDTTIQFFPQHNDIDADGDTLTITQFIQSHSNYGYAIPGLQGGIEYRAEEAPIRPHFDYVFYVISDGNGGEAAGSVQIKINPVNDAPGIYAADIAIREFTYNTRNWEQDEVQFSIFDEEDYYYDSLTVTLSGVDAAQFVTPVNTDLIVFNTPPDYENPTDADGDNVYELTLTVTDSGGLSASTDLQITVNDVPIENPATPGDDTINGSVGLRYFNLWAGNDRFYGKEQDDYADGDIGNDTLFGGDGDDFLSGGAGDDRLDAGAGGNYIYTGTGSDTIIIGHYDGGITENDDFDFTQDKLIIQAFDGNARTVIDSKEELYALDLDGLTIDDDGDFTYLNFNLDDGTSHVFCFNGISQFDLG